jgi:hypothetical protein
LRQLEKVFDERASAGTVSLKFSPVFDSLLSEPRFERLLERAGFKLSQRICLARFSSFKSQLCGALIHYESETDRCSTLSMSVLDLRS